MFYDLYVVYIIISFNKCQYILTTFCYTKIIIWLKLVLCTNEINLYIIGTISTSDK